MAMALERTLAKLHVEFIHSWEIAKQLMADEVLHGPRGLEILYSANLFESGLRQA